MSFFKPVGWDSGKPRRKRRKRRVKSQRVSDDIAVYCPWCNKELRVEYKYVGYTVVCPYCEDRFVAEPPTPSNGSDSGVRENMPVNTKTPLPEAVNNPQDELDSLEVEDDLLAGIEDAPLGDAPLPGMKLCPFCAEYVKKQAIICKHCRSKLD